MINKSILLLISDGLMRSVVTEILERAGYVVISTGDLGSALDWMTKCTPDLLITRSYVSSMTGHEAPKYLKGKRPLMRVLMLGGFLDDNRLRNNEALKA